MALNDQADGVELCAAADATGAAGADAATAATQAAEPAVQASKPPAEAAAPATQAQAAVRSLLLLYLYESLERPAVSIELRGKPYRFHCCTCTHVRYPLSLINVMAWYLTLSLVERWCKGANYHPLEANYHPLEA
jgi:hypothetical protein